MKLATFSHGGSTRIGVVDGDEVVDLSAAAPDLPTMMRAFLGEGKAGIEKARSAIEAGGNRIALADVKLEAPIRHPAKYLAVGLNYQDHIAEGRRTAPKFPILFNKQTSCITGPTDPIHLPRVSREMLDYEGELAVVIGRRCRHVTKEQAPQVIAGYTIANDVSVRDWQRRAPTMTLGKSFDTHGPLGPWIVTPDEIGDPHNLDLRTLVNGEERQNSNTKHLIFDCYQVIETLSTVCTLEPGDLIAMGTPSGVAAYFDPPRFLKTGDVVRIEIEKIGAIENRIIDEPADTALIE